MLTIVGVCVAADGYRYSCGHSTRDALAEDRGKHARAHFKGDLWKDSFHGCAAPACLRLAAGFLHLLVVSDSFGSGLNYAPPPTTEPVIATEELVKPEGEMDAAELCLSRLKKKQTGMFECLNVHLKTKPANEEFDYAPSLALWLHAYPREQVHIVQVKTCSPHECDYLVTMP